MKRNNIVTGALTLGAAAIFVRIAGFVFRVYLSNMLGAEGMGVYSLIMSMYGFCITLSTSGISTAVSTLTAEQLSLGRQADARRILRRAAMMSLALSGIVCAAVFFFAGPISANLLNDPRTEISLRILAVGLPFLSISSCFRGYFIACRRVGNPAVGQILEQFVKMAFIIAVLGHYLPMGIEYACAVVMAGISIGEAVCFFYSLRGYLRGARASSRGEKPVLKGITSKIATMIAPLAFASYIRSSLRLAEDVLIIAGLKAYGGNAVSATGTYGMLKGMVLPLLLFPLMLLSSFVMTLTPEISRLNAKGETARLENTISKILGYTFMAGILIVVVFMTFPQELGAAVYRDENVGDMLRQLSFLCPFMCIEVVAAGILTGLGEQNSSMRYSILDSFARIGMIYFLIPVSGVNGFLITMIVSNLLTSILSVRRLLKITSVKFKLNEWVLKPLLAAAATSQLVLALTRFGVFSAFSARIGLAAGISLACAAYFLVLLSIGSIRTGDLTWIINRIKTSPKQPEEINEPA